LLLQLGFLAGIRVATGCTGRRTGIIIAVDAAVAGRRPGVVVIQHDRQGAADVAQLSAKGGALAPSALQLAVQPGAGRCVLLHHHAEFCLQARGSVEESGFESAIGTAAGEKLLEQQLALWN